jgi:hypothetical protein
LVGQEAGTKHQHKSCNRQQGEMAERHGRSLLPVGRSSRRVS